MLSAYYWPAYR